ncbi:hypothetical protein KM043_006353 [Ampulex compressa]|nr:hypothetical protein KM043_006353 [Ampulex compressa]
MSNGLADRNIGHGPSNEFARISYTVLGMVGRCEQSDVDSPIWRASRGESGGISSRLTSRGSSREPGPERELSVPGSLGRAGPGGAREERRRSGTRANDTPKSNLPDPARLVPFRLVAHGAEDEFTGGRSPFAKRPVCVHTEERAHRRAAADRGRDLAHRPAKGAKGISERAWRKSKVWGRRRRNARSGAFEQERPRVVDETEREEAGARDNERAARCSHEQTIPANYPGDRAPVDLSDRPREVPDKDSRRDWPRPGGWPVPDKFPTMNKRCHELEFRWQAPSVGAIGFRNGVPGCWRHRVTAGEAEAPRWSSSSRGSEFHLAVGAESAGQDPSLWLVTPRSGFNRASEGIGKSASGSSKAGNSW